MRWFIFFSFIGFACSSGSDEKKADPEAHASADQKEDLSSERDLSSKSPPTQNPSSDPCVNLFGERIIGCTESSPAVAEEEWEDASPCTVEGHPYRIPRKLSPPSWMAKPGSVTKETAPFQYSLYYRVRFRLPADWVVPIAFQWGIEDSVGILLKADPKGNAAIMAVAYDDVSEGPTQILDRLTERRLKLRDITVRSLGRRDLYGRSVQFMVYDGTLTTTCERIRIATAVYPRDKNHTVVLSTMIKGLSLRGPDAADPAMSNPSLMRDAPRIFSEIMLSIEDI